MRSTSKHGRQGTQGGFRQLLPVRPFGKSFPVDFFRVLNRRFENVCELVVRPLTMHQQAQLEIEPHRSLVQVGRPDRDEIVVDDDVFRMLDALAVFVDSYALAQESVVIRSSGPDQQRVLAFLGNQQPDVDAAGGGHL